MKVRHCVHLFFSIIFVLLISGCKVSKITSQQDPKGIDSTFTQLIDSIEIEPNWLITQKGDTLDSLFGEVDISISRLLPDTIVIRAVGDIMIGTKFPNPSYLPPSNGKHLWNDVQSYLLTADIAFGNLEGTLLDGAGEPKECKNPDACYLFKMPTKLAQNLVENGFDLISVANNHANDFGKTGRLQTASTLDSLNIAFAGSEERPYIITKIGHLKVGFVAFAPNRGTLTFYDLRMAQKIVSQLDSLSDFVVVSIHGGAEGVENMHVTRKTEFYYGEDRGNIYAFSHAMVDSGADLILGHGPHVVRGIETYKKRLIAYSLGNFLTYGRFNLRGPAGEAPILEMRINDKGEFLEGKIYSFYQSYSDGPLKDDKQRAMRSIQKLSKEDFPENQIIIDDEGRIIYIQN